MSTALGAALYSSMNEFVELVPEPSLIRNSLIFTGLTFRTFPVVISLCAWPPGSVHEAWPTRSLFNGAGPEVILNVALTLARGGTGSAKLLELPSPPETAEVHPGGTEMLNLSPVTVRPVVFVNFTVVS